MVFSKREQLVGFGALGVLLLWGLDSYLLTPFLARKDDVAARHESALRKRRDAADLFSRKSRLQARWDQMTSGGGLKTDSSEAESQVLHALRDWAQESGVVLSNLKPDHAGPAGKDGKFVQIAFHATGSGTMASVSRLIYRVETAQMPLKVDDLQLSSRKEGADDVQIQLSVSTLSIAPDADKVDKKVASGGAGERP